MSKKTAFILLFFSSIISGSEISISISENLVNDYLTLIGNHEIPKGPKANQATWSIKSPEVKFEYGSAEFFTTVTYKKGKTLSQAMRILGFMKDDAHIDVDLFDIFVKKKIYMKYAKGFLEPEQIDEVSI